MRIVISRYCEKNLKNCDGLLACRDDEQRGLPGLLPNTEN